MIVSRDTNPERSLYYLGGKTIEILSDSKNNEAFDYFELYRSLKKNHDISINLFSLTLSWLYVLGIIEKDEKVRLKLCF